VGSPFYIKNITYKLTVVCWKISESIDDYEEAGAHVVVCALAFEWVSAFVALDSCTF